MSDLYKNKTTVVPEYDFDKIKEVINNYLKDNPLQEQWAERIYSCEVRCTSIVTGGFTGEDLSLELEYTDEEYSDIDEDLPVCKKFEAFLKTLSKELPEGVSIEIPCSYYAK